MTMRTMLPSFTITLLLLQLLLTTSAYSQTNIWTGQENSKWNTKANWSLTQIPTAATDVSIPAGLTNYPVINGSDGVAESNNLTIASGASVTVNAGGEGVLRVHGAILNGGTLDITDGTIEIMGLTAYTIPANTFVANTVRNLRIGNEVSVSLGGLLNLTGILKVWMGIFDTKDNLTLKSNAATTALIDEVEGSILGNVTVERFIPAKRAFRFMSSSTTGGTIHSNWQESGADVAGLGTDITGTGGGANGFDVSGSNNPSLFMHNNNTSTWEAVTTTTQTSLQAGAPYRILIRGDRTVDQASNSAPPTNTVLRTTGTVTTGSVLEYSDASPNNGGHFIFLGNPYQAPVDMKAVLDETTNFVKQFYYVWDPTLNTRGSYVTVDVEYNINTVPGSEVNRYLQPNQAFFARIDDNGYTLMEFKEVHKSIAANNNATPNVYRNGNAEPASIAVALYTAESMAANGPAADGFKILFHDSFTNDINSMDAVKLLNMDENTGISNSGSILSLERRALPVDSEILPLNNSTYRATAYTYKMQVNGLQGVTAYLVDKYTNTTTEMINNGETSYAFSIDENPASSAENRFDVTFAENGLGSGSFTQSSFAIYPNPVQDNKFNISLSGIDNATVALYNALGQQISCNTTAVSGNQLAVEPVTQLTAGIYMVQVSSGNKTVTKKILIK